jgi:hypothetical protein
MNAMAFAPALTARRNRRYGMHPEPNPREPAIAVGIDTLTSRAGDEVQAGRRGGVRP